MSHKCCHATDSHRGMGRETIGGRTRRFLGTGVPGPRSGSPPSQLLPQDPGGLPLLDRQVPEPRPQPPPAELGIEEVRGFLSELAVRYHVAASTQNQASNTLLFFYRHILRREFGQLDGVVLAKRHRYIPVVLSQTSEDPYFCSGVVLRSETS